MGLKDYENNVLDIEELSYYNEFQLLSKIVLEWDKASKDKNISERSKLELQNVITSVTKIGIYVSNMQSRQREYNSQISKWRRKCLNLEAEITRLIELDNNEK